MKQKKYLLATLLILVSLSIYFAFFHNKTAYSKTMEISLQDTNSITEIHINQANNNVKIAKIGSKWFVNDAYNANEFAIKRLLRIFKNLEINTLIPKNEHDSIINLLAKTGISLSFYSSNKQNTRYTFGDFDKTRNATLLISEDEFPVYVSAPGLTANLQEYVEADAIFWRNRRIFDFESNEINSITFFDYKKPSQSFNIKLQKSDFEVFDQQRKPYNFDKEKVSRYISYFKGIEFESVAKELSLDQIDSILNSKPFYLIKVKYNSGNEFDLKILPVQLQNDSTQFDLNKAYGIINNQKPIVMIDYFAVDPIIKSIGYFKVVNSEK